MSWNTCTSGYFPTGNKKDTQYCKFIRETARTQFQYMLYWVMEAGIRDKPYLCISTLLSLCVEYQISQGYPPNKPIVSSSSFKSAMILALKISKEANYTEVIQFYVDKKTFLS